MPSDNKKNVKIFKIKVRKALYRARKYLVGLTALGAVASSPFHVQGQNLSPKEKKSPTDTASVIHAHRSPFDDNRKTEGLLAYGRMIEVDIGNEVGQRAEWVVDQFVTATSRHLKAIKKATANGQKSAYVKKNFFNVVYPRGGLSGKTDYCITAINRALMDANSCGDLNSALPQYATEGVHAVECNRFVAFLTRKGFGDCIKRGRLNAGELTAGDIVMTPRGGASYHAMTYIGNGKVRSFNNDGEWALPKRTGIVIKIRSIAEKAIMNELKNRHLIDAEKGNLQVVPLQNAQKMMQFLYNGRHPSKTNAERNVYAARPQNNPSFFASASSSPNLYATRRNNREM